MYRNGRPLTEYKLQTKIHTGLEILGFPGVIPHYYEMDACEKANYRYFHDWQELTGKQKSLIVAKYIASNLLEAHKNDAQSRYVQEKRGR